VAARTTSVRFSHRHQEGQSSLAMSASQMASRLLVMVNSLRK
jgi:hypothetical protein